MKKSNNQQLQELLDKHKKSRKWVAAVVGTNLSTVDRWLVPLKDPDDRRRKNTTYRAMPTACLNLIKIVIGEMMPAELRDLTNEARKIPWPKNE